MNRMPTFYKPPLGLPFNWRDEMSGELPAAVAAYLDNRIDGTTITDAQIALLREFLIHYINAPCWDNGAFESELNNLRESAPHLDSATEISEWIFQCMEIGLDPL
jgi:hypothetical protein